MKNNLLRNAFYGIAALFLITTTSCDSDDDLPTGPSITVNTFCYGLDSLNSTDVFDAFNREVLETTTAGVFNTRTFIVDDNITVDNGQLDGTGFLITLDLYGNREQEFQSGTYAIGDTEDVADAVITYFTDYDASMRTNVGVELVSGFVGVSPFRTGYALEIDGIDANGDRFHGIYLGEVTPLN
ncbi:hypothetical protein [Nonlabens sp. Asnod2-A12]|uniref:hypothetical protein n=1 Tax=Nonlabens sp. Asnod2-A12 TaxID=3160578 RepID=UPI00386FD2F6